MDLEKRNDFRHFATWLRDMEYLTDEFILIPYELAELYLESDYYRKLGNGEGNTQSDTESKLNLAGVINRCPHCNEKIGYLNYKEHLYMNCCNRNGL